MARTNAAKPSKTTRKTSAKSSTVSKSKRSSNEVRVKSSKEVAATVGRMLSYNLHDRYKFSFSKATKAKLTAYGPWLGALSVLVISPQLMSLAKNSQLLSISGFFNEIFFNQQAWVILVIILINVLLFVDGLTDLFEVRLRGWNRMYLPALITALYVIWQLFGHLDQPAAPILSLLGSWLVLFTLLDVKSLYKK